MMNNLLMAFLFGLAIGIFLTYQFYKFHPKVDKVDNTDQAIQYLKDKGYYVNIKAFTEKKE
jgi:hypothetical protein